MKGRKPLPTAVKRLRKTLRKDRVNADEPQPEVVLVGPPAFLEGAALKEWHRIAPELYELGLLTNLDRAALAAYCTTLAQWEAAEDGLKESSLLVKAPNGNVVPNPLISVANRSRELCVKFAAEFGFTPSSRSRVKASPKNPKPEKGAWGKFGAANKFGREKRSK